MVFRTEFCWLSGQPTGGRCDDSCARMELARAPTLLALANDPPLRGYSFELTINSCMPGLHSVKHLCHLLPCPSMGLERDVFPSGFSFLANPQHTRRRIRVAVRGWTGRMTGCDWVGGSGEVVKRANVNFCRHQGSQ